MKYNAKIYKLAWALAAMSLGFVQGAYAQGPVHIFAAASLRGALDEAADLCAQGVDAPILVYAGSSVLARQITQGAPADIFISAHPAWMEYAATQGMIAPDTRADLLGNRLVLVAPKDAEIDAIDLESFDFSAHLAGRPMAMGLVRAVPAGIYGKAAWEHFGRWPEIAPQLAQTDNVRAALALVTAGEAPLGVVYASDARAESGVKIVATFPANSHPDIRYPAALTVDAQAGATAILRCLMSDNAMKIFVKNGFIPADGG